MQRQGAGGGGAGLRALCEMKRPELRPYRPSCLPNHGRQRGGRRGPGQLLLETAGAEQSRHPGQQADVRRALGLGAGQQQHERDGLAVEGAPVHRLRQRRERGDGLRHAGAPGVRQRQPPSHPRREPALARLDVGDDPGRVGHAGRPRQPPDQLADRVGAVGGGEVHGDEPVGEQGRERADGHGRPGGPEASALARRVGRAGARSSLIPSPEAYSWFAARPVHHP